VYFARGGTVSWILKHVSVKENEALIGHYKNKRIVERFIPLRPVYN
jgi:hypothetical protein